MTRPGAGMRLAGCADVACIGFEHRKKIAMCLYRDGMREKRDDSLSFSTHRRARFFSGRTLLSSRQRRQAFRPLALAYGKVEWMAWAA